MTRLDQDLFSIDECQYYKRCNLTHHSNGLLHIRLIWKLWNRPTTRETQCQYSKHDCGDYFEFQMTIAFTNRPQRRQTLKHERQQLPRVYVQHLVNTSWCKSSQRCERYTPLLQESLLGWDVQYVDSFDLADIPGNHISKWVGQREV